MPAESSETYVLGYADNIVKQLNTRSVAREGAFVLPYLQPDHNFLDVGCGPGSISLGFAKALTAGNVQAIDVDAEQIAIARKAASQQDVTNIEFQQADVYALPFADNQFDCVFAHTVFMHLSDPAKALRELWRVCKPGGVIAIREGAGGFDHFSDFPLQSRYIDLSQLLMAVTGLNEGKPYIAVQLKSYLQQAGFECVAINSRSEVYTGQEDMQLLLNWYQSIFSGELGCLAVSSGLLSESELQTLLNSMHHWLTDTAAVSLVAWLQYIARKH